MVLGELALETAIEINKLVKEFRVKSGRFRALNEVSFSIGKGEIIGLVGPNGAGKTTLMSCMLGILKPNEGSINIDGMSPDALSVHKQVGFVPERLNYINWMTGRQFVTFHAKLSQFEKSKIPEEAGLVLERVQLDRTAWDRKIKSYSRGMLQRVGMAQALLHSPNFLFLDEPSSGLDPEGINLFRTLIKEEKDRGCTIVINSHQLDQLEKVSDRVILLKNGSIKGDRSIKDLTTLAGTLQVKWSPEVIESIELEILTVVAEKAGAELEQFNFPIALFKTAGEAMNTKLIAELNRASIPIAEAIPTASKLEQFFDLGDFEGAAQNE